MDLWNSTSSVTLLLMILALCAWVKESLAITCYMCNSAPTRNSERCETLSGDTSVFVQDCGLLSRSDNLTYTVCRKMHQTIYGNDGNEEVRIIRQCGTDSPMGCAWRTRPNTLQVETCHCDTDLCNAAHPVCKPRWLLLCASAVWISTWLLSFRPGVQFV